MPENSLLTPLLAGRTGSDRGDDATLRLRALQADPALRGRVDSDDSGAIVLCVPGGAPVPTSAKERARWELHVRLRLAAELGDSAAADVDIRWCEAGAPDPQRSEGTRSIARGSSHTAE
jgi:hypothetical protein